MNHNKIHYRTSIAVLLAGLVTAGAAMAQAPSPPAAPMPGSVPVSREAVRAEARAHSHSQANSNTPGGEASTTRNGQPNSMPTPVSGTTRAEVRQGALKTRPNTGVQGERPDVPTNPQNATGTPK